MTYSLSRAALVAMVWSVMYFANEYVFEAAQYTRVANLIFLPAMIRPLAILVYGNAGFVGLFLGAMITFPLQPLTLSSLLLVSFASSAPAWLAIRWISSLLSYASQFNCALLGLRLKTILLIAVLTAALSASTHYLVFWAAPQIEHSLPQALSMFLGDVIGSFLMLYLLSIFVRYMKQRHINIRT